MDTSATRLEFRETQGVDLFGNKVRMQFDDVMFEGRRVAKFHWKTGKLGFTADVPDAIRKLIIEQAAQRRTYRS